MKGRHRTKLGVETLERRDLMAAFPPRPIVIEPPQPISEGGNVTAEVIDGMLFVRGDSAGNQIEIFYQGNGNVVLHGFNGQTRVNGQNTQPSGCNVKVVALNGVTRGIQIDMSEGDDIVWLKGRALPDVTIATGNGDDYVALGGFVPQYGCVITHSIKFPGPAVILGNVSIDTGDGDDLVHPFAVVKGNAEIRTGRGADQVVEPDAVVIDSPIHQDLQVVGTTLVDLGPGRAGNGDSAPANLGRFLTGTSIRALGGNVISWDQPWYPKFDIKVLDSFMILDGARSRVVAHAGGGHFKFADIDVLGWPEPLLRSDGTILLDISYSPTDPAFVDRLGAIGITPYATDEAGGHVSAWINVQQLHALRDMEGLERVSLQLSALVGPTSTFARYDVDGDGSINPNDALIVIDALNHGNDRPLTQRDDIPAGVRVDVDGDGLLTPADALEVINILNSPEPAIAQSSGGAEGEGTSSVHNSDLLALAADEVFRDLVAPRRRRAR
jgi:hypothetical protein